MDAAKLRVLQTFASVLREKNRTRTSFMNNKTNFISIQTFANVVFDKNLILARCYIRHITLKSGARTVCTVFPKDIREGWKNH